MAKATKLKVAPPVEAPASRLFIPNLGALIVLAEDWTFKLYFEDRNSKMINAINTGPTKVDCWRWNHDKLGEEFEHPKIQVEYEKAMTEEELEKSYRSYSATNSEDNAFIRITLPAGTVLTFDRIYIRRGSEAFNSVTFRTNKNCPFKELKSQRFWAKLQDVNRIVCNIIG